MAGKERNCRVSHTDILEIGILKIGLIDLQQRKQYVVVVEEGRLVTRGIAFLTHMHMQWCVCISVQAAWAMGNVQYDGDQCRLERSRLDWIG